MDLVQYKKNGARKITRRLDPVVVLPAVPKNWRTSVIRENGPVEKLNSIDNVCYHFDADERDVSLALLELENFRLIKKLSELEAKRDQSLTPKGFKFNIEFPPSNDEIQKIGIHLVDGYGNTWEMDLVQYKKNDARKIIERHTTLKQFPLLEAMPLSVNQPVSVELQRSLGVLARCVLVVLDVARRVHSGGFVCGSSDIVVIGRVVGGEV
ncbi:hypothetical protein Vadar_010891 [Vaccinium darrowii]|uniref:Uncharacterized protein n=1 Tax=Vaccinium darrowii TaxID=229202 RepID=A0ACB7ZCZ7_9ERIC|nr:hypothetical protein Vadar_010891 [Vaccinium darrowii]